MRNILILFGVLTLGLLPAGPVAAHTPLCSCYDNGDGTITCEGGFSDGSSATGMTMRVVDVSGKTVITGKMNEDSEFTCKKPDGPYKVEFDAGPGHLIEITGEDIVE